ncbi:MAG TPA: 4-hydroxyphenylacetate 3-hydroxylase N-terminal domain-containing protein [Candidatus Binataceae bacterium]|nr:4-hydroxyphenylacetate 3-hydroxylase N-terminal domain-containing protein [Candidatus Binataceae bacterium]
MGIRSGKQFIESLRDGRTVYVLGEKVKDVTAYPPFRGIIGTLASLYDLQNERRDELSFTSPSSGEPVAASFLMAETAEQVHWRIHAEQTRADYTYGLMGRMPDFCNALVTDVATGLADLGRREPRFGDNMNRYYLECRERDWCLTHTLVDPQVDRSRGPSEQPDPFLVLRAVRETDRGVIVRGAKMLATLAPFSNELWVGPFLPRRAGEEDYALCFSIPCDTDGLKFICREPYDNGRGDFDRPLTSHYDEEDSLAVFDDVLVPWERMFIYRDIEIFNSILLSRPGYTQLQAVIRGLAKLRLMTGLAFHIAETIGRADAIHIQAQIGELVANVELVSGLVRAAADEVAAATRERLAHRSTSAALWVLVPQCQMRAAQVIRELSGSGLIMTPSEKDFANPEIAGYLEKYLRGKEVSALDRVQLFKLAWDLIGEPFGARQLQYEWFYAGDPYFTRQRFFRSAAATEYKETVKRLLASRQRARKT